MPTTYTKLRSGSWGIRSTEALAPGQTVVVTKKDGETKPETVDKVVWSGDGVWLAAVRKSDAPSKPSRRRDPNRPGRNGMMPGCGNCKALGRMCKQCRFDEFDE